MLPKVFDLFTQIDRTLGRAQGGLGIGLALVKSLVQMHGGSVEARSDGPGQGSEFVVRLAVCSPAGTGSLRTDRAALAGRSVLTGRKILVVDDNRDAANSLAMLLRCVGAEVHTAYDGPSALEAVRAYHPPIVFLDIGMPGMDGYAVAAQIRQDPECRQVTVIALTGWGQEDDRRRTKAAGFDYHLVKPPELITVTELLSQLPASDP
jgi:CheY-like chemotaxis protein